MQEYTISYQNLVPESTYLFRVIAYNKYSISYPAESQDEVNIKKSFKTNVFIGKAFDLISLLHVIKNFILQKENHWPQTSDN